MTTPDNHAALTERLTQLETRVERQAADFFDYVRMDDPTALTERLARLEARVERQARSLREYIDIVARYVKDVDRDQQYAFERIINLELKVFPHLKGDIARLHAIIGDYHDKADQPLDRRKP